MLAQLVNAIARRSAYRACARAKSYILADAGRARLDVYLSGRHRHLTDQVVALKSAPGRAPGAPDVHTVSESRLPDFDALAWFELLTPTGTLPANLLCLHAEHARASAIP